MSFKPAKCPRCKKHVSSLWYYFSKPFTEYTCSNCKTRIKWHPIVFLHYLIFGVSVIGGYHFLQNVFEPRYIGGIMAIIIGLIVFYILPKQVQVTEKK